MSNVLPYCPTTVTDHCRHVCSCLFIEMLTSPTKGWRQGHGLQLTAKAMANNTTKYLYVDVMFAFFPPKFLSLAIQQLLILLLSRKSWKPHRKLYFLVSYQTCIYETICCSPAVTHSPQLSCKLQRFVKFITFQTNLKGL